MYKSRIIIIASYFIAFPFIIYGQNCSKIELAINYIESVLVADLFYTGNFDKEDIKEPTIWYINERIPFDAVKTRDSICIIKKEIELPNQTVIRKKANYLLFASNIYNDKLLIKLVHNRHSMFNVPGGKTEYEKWSRMNGGMVYLFHFDNNGCLRKISKEFEFRD